MEKCSVIKVEVRKGAILPDLYYILKPLSLLVDLNVLCINNLALGEEKISCFFVTI